MFHSLQLEEHGASGAATSRPVRFVCAFMLALLSIALAFVVATTEKAGPELARQALHNLSLSGVANPVTAVLLNFRGYDTLLEIAVLLVVAVVMKPAVPVASRHLLTPNSGVVTAPVLASMMSWLVPLCVLVAAYLLWTGAYAPGGAFQAGAVLAGAGVALLLVQRPRISYTVLTARWMLVAGLLVFVLVAAAVTLVTGTVLEFPPDYAGPMILFIEAAATLSIGFILLLLVGQLLTAVSEQVAEG